MLWKVRGLNNMVCFKQCCVLDVIDDDKCCVMCSCVGSSHEDRSAGCYKGYECY